MKIGLISDTHDNIKNIENAISVFSNKRVSFVIHAGDIISPRLDNNETMLKAHKQPSDASDASDMGIVSYDNLRKNIFENQNAQGFKMASDTSYTSDSTSNLIEVSNCEVVVPDTIYRAYGDTWKCHNCTIKGDKWFMIKHDCKGAKK